MMTVRNPKAIALATTVLCMASLVWLMSTLRVNNTLETNLQNAKLKGEALLSEKLLLEKDIEKMRGQLSSLKGINTDLDNLVSQTEARMSSQESELRKLKKQNSSLTQVRKQREELLQLKTDLEGQLLALRASYADMENTNMVLSNTIAQLQEQNRLLTRDLNNAMFATMDHTQVQAVKGKKERLTVKAKRTHKLVADFQIPASLRNVSFRILDQNGNVLTDKQGMIVSKTDVSDENVVASIGDNGAGNGQQKVHMEYIPKQRMRSGTYTVEILNDNLYVGSLNVKLR